ncbi:hypothetical protein P7K49_013202 [Saguinus oedipus]|uniref:Uncharacterized protein n=1 Tax=Saguinus oedipus TaxID=9490 RepID=A0ABQ9VI47_SAGOE|nr:hypothetical protein P7K49_013202 [Saguinus oedipus]
MPPEDLPQAPEQTAQQDPSPVRPHLGMPRRHLLTCLLSRNFTATLAIQKGRWGDRAYAPSRDCPSRSGQRKAEPLNVRLPGSPGILTPVASWALPWSVLPTEVQEAASGSMAKRSGLPYV